MAVADCEQTPRPIVDLEGCARIRPMAKKKNQAKRHKFKHVEGSPNLAATETVPAKTGGTKSKPAREVIIAAAGASNAQRDFSYVGADLKRIAVLAGSLVVLEIVLWYLLAHTAVGTSIYNFLQV